MIYGHSISTTSGNTSLEWPSTFVLTPFRVCSNGVKFGGPIRTQFSLFLTTLKWSNVTEVCSQNFKTLIFVDIFVPVICLVTQSDMGTENVGIANAHTVLRQSQDPSLAGTIQHRYMWDKKNIMPEIEWSQLRRRWTPGFEDLLDIGVRNGWYSVENTLERYGTHLSLCKY